MRKSKYRSAAAHDAILAATDKSWTRNMTNEHQDEIESVWQWIRTNQDSLTPEDIIERFRRYPIVVITKDEDKALRKHKRLNAAERYQRADIKVLVQGEDGVWIEWTGGAAMS